MKEFLKKDGAYAVVGLGASGLSALRFLYRNGYKVSATDAGNPAVELPSDVATYFGELNAELLASVDGIVISPGVNPAHSAIVNAKAKGVPVVSDVQLAVDECHLRKIPIVAITGSNAKSTVTTLVGEMAKNAGGNCGAWTGLWRKVFGYDSRGAGQGARFWRIGGVDWAICCVGLADWTRCWFD